MGRNRSIPAKNVREFLGETGKAGKINKAIGHSYLSDPDWFWYKHNGIIILADDIFIDRVKNELVLRNPQIINGGQTLKALFSAYSKNNKAENSAKVLLRIYRLPYEDAETYKRSIEIISALNSQNKINPSDLRSTDPRQVRLERLFQQMGSGYRYWRKRSKEAKSSRYSIKFQLFLFWVSPFITPQNNLNFMVGLNKLRSLNQQNFVNALASLWVEYELTLSLFMKF